MFVDKAKVSLKAGKGGDGAVSFRHEIYIPKGGPDGGDGGKGGDIIFRADRNTNTLVDFRFTPILTAEDGKNGSGQRSSGRSGKDLVVDVPVGTIIYRLKSGTLTGDTAWGSPAELEAKVGEDVTAGSVERLHAPSTGDTAWGSPMERSRDMGEDAVAGPVENRTLIADLTKDGQEAIIAKGGSGGFGNAHFKSSTRQAPLIAEVGEPGEEFEAELELKSMADIGLVGLPNAGKSTFLSVVSNATPEIADYPFTTLTPQLGVATIDGHDLLIADIPGLIEGASEGKGLGHEFLRHVERTAVLLHLVDVYSNDAGAAYRTIRKELEKYGDLASRPEVVALTKCEGVDHEIIEMQMASILKVNPEAQVYAISASAHQGLTELLRALRERVLADLTGDTAGGVPMRNSSTGDIAGRVPMHNPSTGDVTWGPPAELEAKVGEDVTAGPVERSAVAGPVESTSLPTISLSKDALKTTWKIEKTDDGKFVVTGEKIEKFARRTDLNNYASINRLRDIMKKMGIRGELTSKGAQPDSIISIAGKEFTLVEDW